MSANAARDVVEMLREAGGIGADLSPGDPLCNEAADEIARLRVKLDEAADSLRPFAEMSKKYPKATAERVSVAAVSLGSEAVRITVGDLRRARTTLARLEEEK